MIKNYVKFIPEIYPRIVIIAVLTVGLAVGGGRGDPLGSPNHQVNS